MKSDGRLARCPLKGAIGDAIFAVLCGCGHNIRKMLAHIQGIVVRNPGHAGRGNRLGKFINNRSGGVHNHLIGLFRADE